MRTQQSTNRKIITLHKRAILWDRMPHNAAGSDKSFVHSALLQYLRHFESVRKDHGHRAAH